MPLRPTDRPVAILVAVREEFNAIAARVSRPSGGERVEPAPGEVVRQANRSVDGTSGGVVLCGKIALRPVVLGKSGLGIERARTKAAALLETHNPAFLLIAGFACSLRPDIRPASVLIADSVRLARTIEDDPHFTPRASLLNLAALVSLPGVATEQGPLITIERFIPDVAGKLDASRRFSDALAFDMESAAAAEVAESRGVPWIVVRTISDGAEDPMPLPFDRYIGPDGDVSRVRIMGAATLRPWKIPGLVRLGVRSGRAAGNLAEFVEAYVRSLPVRA